MGNSLTQETSTISSFTGSWANNSTSVDDESDHVIFNNKGFSSSEDLTDTDDHEIEGDDDVFSALENDANYVQAGMHCLLPPTKISLTSLSAAYEASGIKVTMQNGTVCKEDECCLTMAVFINTTPCSYPENIQKISPILMLHPNREVTLLKPIQITIPHFLRSKIDSEDNLAHIGVLKASQIGKNDKFRFEKVLGCKVIRFGNNDDGDGTAIFEIEHFCFFQLYADSAIKELAMKSRYCLCRLDPIEDTYPRLYYYVLTYKLDLFIKSVDEQFPKHKRNKVMEFQFNSRDKQIIVKNSFQIDNWNIAFEDSKTNDLEVIHASSLEKWGEEEQEDLKLNVECGLYPPMFKLQICPKSLSTAEESLKVCVLFEGIKKVPPNETSDVVDNMIIKTCTGALPEGRAEANCPGSQALDTPQNQALHSHLPSIISLISSDVVNVAGLMSQHKLIPRQLYERTVQVTGIDNHVKATELMITISAQVKINRSTFNTFLKVLENAGDYTANLIEQLKTTAYPQQQVQSVDAPLPSPKKTTDHGVNSYNVLGYLQYEPDFSSKLQEQLSNNN